MEVICLITLAKDEEEPTYSACLIVGNVLHPKLPKGNTTAQNFVLPSVLLQGDEIEVSIAETTYGSDTYGIATDLVYRNNTVKGKDLPIIGTVSAELVYGNDEVTRPDGVYVGKREEIVYYRN